MAIVAVVGSSGLADVRVRVVESQGLADLLVCPVSSQGSARGNDGLWCFVDSVGLASSRVYYTSSGSDLTICFVDSQGLSGWRRSHALQGRL